MSEASKRAMPGGSVRLTVPARVANDLDRLQDALGRLAERMGHPECASGCDTLFLELQREFSVSVEGELNPQPIPPGIGLSQDASRIGSVEVSLPDRVSSDIGLLQQAVALTLDKLGCSSCCSGFDIAFRRELDLITISEDLEVKGSGRFR
jgi:hypothetical protein